MNKHKYSRSSEPSLQAASMPIDNRRFFQGGLLDCLAPAQTVQNWLSACTNGKPSHLLSFQCSTIHNYRLSIVLPTHMIHRGSQTIVSDTYCIVSVDDASLSFLAFPWVKNRKMETSIFSVFKRT